MIAQWMLAGTLFTLLAAIAARSASFALRVMQRPTRFAWLAAFVASAVWMAAAPLMRAAPEPLPRGPSIDVVSPVWRVVSVSARSTTSIDVSPARAFDIDTLLLTGWMFASAFLLARLTLMFRRLSRVRQLGYRAIIDGVDVRVTPDVGPALVGARNMEIVVPAWLELLDPGLRALVLRHENEHRIARDPYLIWIANLGSVLMPWNLPAWFILSRLRLAIEIDCDARTLAHGADRDRYAKLLLFIAQHRTTLPFASMLAGAESNLSKRINAMCESRLRFPRTSISAACAIAAAATIVACSTRVSDDPVAPNFRSVSDAAGTSAISSDSARDAHDSPSVSTLNLRNTIEVGPRPVLHTPPQILTLVPPVYPARMKDARHDAVVLAQFVVTESGVADPKSFRIAFLSASTTRDSIEVGTATRDAILSGKFKPTMVAGRSVRQRVSLPVFFMQGHHVDVHPLQLWWTEADELVELRVLGVTSPGSARTDAAGALLEFQVDRPADLKSPLPEFEYPPMLRAARVEGMVVMQVVVGTDGVADPRTFKILEASHPAFATSVERALPRMKFTPATLKGRAVRQLLQIPLSFRLPR